MMAREASPAREENSDLSVFVDLEEVNGEVFLDSARVSVSLRCPKCVGSGKMRHPIWLAARGLAELSDEDLDSVLSKRGKDIAKGVAPVEFIKCPVCEGEKWIRGQVSVAELLGGFCRPKGGE
jgi:hypothetical protein